MSYMSIRGLAIVIIALVIGYAMLPDFLFFPVTGVVCLIVGLLVVGSHPAWGVGLIVVGLAMAGFSVKSVLDHYRKQREEAAKAEAEVRRRMGRVRED